MKARSIITAVALASVAATSAWAQEVRVPGQGTVVIAPAGGFGNAGVGGAAAGGFTTVPQVQEGGSATVTLPNGVIITMKGDDNCTTDGNKVTCS
ncbi:MAG: hypothetical protein QNJ30_22185 [Kiloniellales bacterium]|nr:hypothetical protein [Kiloniellales bacterium]